MAAAARSGPPDARDTRDARDARVPCPQCGGLIHPIAGKCKHCKADLTAYRAARPAASAPLPALSHAASIAGNGLPPHAPIAHAVAMPLAAQTVLPQPGRADTAPPSATPWRSWPVVVIVVAMLAIVAAVVLMVWPAGHARDGKRALQPPPAPERMDTQTPPVTPRVDPPRAAPAPAAPQAAPQDPWATPTPAVPAPRADSPTDPSAQADPAGDDDADPSDAIDPFASQPPGRRAPRGALPHGGGMLAFAMAARLCRKLAQCGASDGTMKTTCDAIANLPSDPPAGCPAAERCLRHIDALGCSAQPDALQLGMLLLQFRDCAEAERC